jgi:2-keto-4-pentenoate hydratase/2-oxohepta-3-ene-1,7-dioic acid hydratase in catechol pathway
MKFVSFRAADRLTWGLVEEDFALDLGSALDGAPTLKSYLANKGLVDLQSAKAAAIRHPVNDLHWAPVIPDPDKILCVGLNYETHRKETGRAEVSHPTIFGRFANTQIAHLQPIVRPKVSSDLDFEGELAVVIGKAGRYIERSEALAHVAGFSCYNDGSIRDWQHHTHQFTPGKNFPGTGAFGPYLVTPDEVGVLDDLTIKTILNGEVVQDARLGQMIFDIPTIIEYCSSFTRLEIGDVILTGTPGGVGVKRTPPLWMKPGDVVEVVIDHVGVLRNTISQEQ